MVTTAPTGAVLLSLDGITHTFGRMRALDGASLQVRAGSVHALLGENGAGKTTLMRVVFGLLRAQQGEMHWRGAPITMRSPSDALAHGIGMVHQHFTLVPSMTVAENIALGGHGGFDPQQTADRVRHVAARAGLVLDPTACVQDLPVGAQQRCEIVKALARDVTLLILDEPVSALDVSIQAGVVNLLQDIQKDLGLSYVFIAHDLSVVRHISDVIGVMYLGKLVEVGPAESVYTAPLHPYTMALLSAVPVPDSYVEKNRKRVILTGDIPSPTNMPTGCAFHTRCPLRAKLGNPEICSTTKPGFQNVEANDGPHQVSCHFALEAK